MSEQNWFRSPRRFFLDAPKEQPGTCFVKNEDYAEAMEEITRLQQEMARYENGRVVLTGAIDRLRQAEQVSAEVIAASLREIDRLKSEAEESRGKIYGIPQVVFVLASDHESVKLKLQQVTLERDAMLERIAEFDSALPTRPSSYDTEK